MKFSQCTPTILKLCADVSLDFRAKGKEIFEAIKSCSLDDFLEHVDNAGVIPECFGHDSTEEKVFAKYCDALLARGFAEIGLESQIIEERSDAADVLAKGKDYTLVGDAKAFRLSRTAKNQKDFKVEPLNTWRKGADYALLVSPYYQYPNTNSQIYIQAGRYNVTLLSYMHLSFLIRSFIKSKGVFKSDLKELWKIGNALKQVKSAGSYWGVVTQTILKITGGDSKEWTEALKKAKDILPKQAKEQITYWQNEKERLEKLTHDEAVKELVKALKIDTKIEIIKRTAGI